MPSFFLLALPGGLKYFNGPVLLGKRPKPFPCLGIPGFIYRPSLILYHASLPLSSPVTLASWHPPLICHAPIATRPLHVLLLHSECSFLPSLPT